MDPPPEEPVALAAGYEAGLGEAVGAGGYGHEPLTSMSFEYRPSSTPPYSGFGSSRLPWFTAERAEIAEVIWEATSFISASSAISAVSSTATQYDID